MMMERVRTILLVLAVVGIVAVILLIERRETAVIQPPVQSGVTTPVAPADLEVVTGQLVFVPAYAAVGWLDANNTIRLTATLAIHNADLTHPIVIRSVRYYDTAGVLVREFVETPVQLPPLATTGFVVPATDDEAGWGTNFLVEWSAATSVYEPVIEAVMVSQRGSEGISFISPGRVLTEQRP